MLTVARKLTSVHGVHTRAMEEVICICGANASPRLAEERLLLLRGLQALVERANIRRERLDLLGLELALEGEHGRPGDAFRDHLGDGVGITAVVPLVVAEVQGLEGRVAVR